MGSTKTPPKPAEDAFSSDSKLAAVYTNQMSPRLRVIDRGFPDIKNSLCLRKAHSVSGSSTDFVDLYACCVTGLRNIQATLPKRCPAVNCMRPRSFNAWMDVKVLLRRMSRTDIARSSFLDVVLSISTTPRCSCDTSIVTPRALVDELNSGAFAPSSAKDQPRSFSTP